LSTAAKEILVTTEVSHFSQERSGRERFPAFACFRRTNETKRTTGACTLFPQNETKEIHGTMTFLALITGGGTGVGRADALALSQVEDNAAVVIITGRRLEPLAKAQAEIGPDWCHIVADCDTGSVDAWERVVAKVEELGGKLHFVGNTAGAGGPYQVPYESIDPEELAAYNASYVTGLQLSYHFMAPFLCRGADDRGVPSVVVDMSSSTTIMNRESAAWLPLYYASKVARSAITKTAYGMYKDKGIVAYGINPFVYLTEMLVKGCEAVGITPEQHSQMLNPFQEQGDPADLGHLSVAAALHKVEGLESGVSYCMFPIPLKYRDEDDPDRTGSILYSAAAVHGADQDGLDYDETKLALTKISRAWYSSGKAVPEPTLRKIVEGMVEAIQRCSHQQPKR
jgi:NAD(P)-dependent dehydrogenase (short-subunit alcohol dehydrogenase family)